jgi:hypothetical protein
MCAGVGAPSAAPVRRVRDGLKGRAPTRAAASGAAAFRALLPLHSNGGAPLWSVIRMGAPILNRPTANRPQVRNHEAVVKFALRGPGQPGPQPVMAPLADPTAVPALGHMQEADAALRHVVHALLVGVDAKQVSPQALQVRSSENKCGREYSGTHLAGCAEPQVAGTTPPPIGPAKLG